MDNIIKEELHRMKYLFSHERGRVISEQKESDLLLEDIGKHPKDQAEGDAFRKYLNTPPMTGYVCQTGQSKGQRLINATGKKFTGPCMQAAWAQYGEKFRNPVQSTTNTAQTPTNQVVTVSDEKNEPTGNVTTNTGQGSTTTTNTGQGQDTTTITNTNTGQGASTTTNTSQVQPQQQGGAEESTLDK